MNWRHERSRRPRSDSRRGQPRGPGRRTARLEMGQIADALLLGKAGRRCVARRQRWRWRVGTLRRFAQLSAAGRLAFGVRPDAGVGLVLANLSVCCCSALRWPAG